MSGASRGNTNNSARHAAVECASEWAHRESPDGHGIVEIAAPLQLALLAAAAMGHPGAVLLLLESDDSLQDESYFVSNACTQYVQTILSYYTKYFACAGRRAHIWLVYLSS